MTRGRSDDTLTGSATAPRPWRLRPETDGGFTIVGPQRAEARPEGAGLSICGEGSLSGARLIEDETAHGWLLLDTADAVLGRVSSLTGRSIAEDPPSVMLSDGRLFRVVRTGGGFALLGWEGPGPYLEFASEGPEWLVSETAAGRGMEDLNRLVLLAAVTILADEPPAN